LDFLKQQNIEAIFVMPPFAPTVHDKLEVERASFGYVQELEARLAVLPDHYNFQDGAKVPSTDCEYINGLHPGDTVMTRIIRILARKNAYLSASLDMKIVKARAALKNRASALTPDETDFLALKCKKPGPARL
jgi:hypothetical protein